MCDVCFGLVVGVAIVDVVCDISVMDISRGGRLNVVGVDVCGVCVVLVEIAEFGVGVVVVMRMVGIEVVGAYVAVGVVGCVFIVGVYGVA